MSIISIANRKGGVGKTTSAQALADALKMKGEKVLLVDMDPQASLTENVGLDPEEMMKSRTTMYHRMRDVVEKTEDVIVKVNGYEIIPNLLDSQNIDGELQALKNMGKLDLILDEVRDKYDYILIDTSPSLPGALANSLIASDYYILAVSTKKMSIRGMEDAIRTAFEVSANINENLKLIGVIPTLYQRTTKISQMMLEQIQKVVEGIGFEGVKVFDPIHQSVAIEKASVEFKSIVNLDPENENSKTYIEIAEVIKNVTK